MISRRLDLVGGRLFIERHPRTVLIDIPRGRLPLASVEELTEVIHELMAVREEMLEEPPPAPRTFVNQGTGDA